MYTKKGGYSHWMWIILIAVVLLLAWLIWWTVNKDIKATGPVNNIAPAVNTPTEQADPIVEGTEPVETNEELEKQQEQEQKAAEEAAKAEEKRVEAVSDDIEDLMKKLEEAEANNAKAAAQTPDQDIAAGEEINYIDTSAIQQEIQQKKDELEYPPLNDPGV